MKQFVDVFVEEASELIDQLEASLLVLESSPSDSLAIDSVFRVMHTLKGNAKMFGFERMGELTHQLENIYDKIRSEHNIADNKVLSTTLSVVDHLRNILIDPSLKIESNKLKQKELEEKIMGIVSNKSLINSIAPTGVASQVISFDRSNAISTYYISFYPDTDLMRNGTNPSFILEDIAALGKSKINAHKKDIPAFDQLDPTGCYTYWEIYLATNKSVEEIEEVFLFVQDSAKINICRVADEDLLRNNVFLKKIEEDRQQQVLINIDELQQYVNHLLNIIRENSVDENSTTEITEQKISILKVSSDKIDLLMNLVSELVTTQARLSNISEGSNLPGLSTVSEIVEKLSRQLRDNVFSISLIPVNQLFMRFQRMVRDLSMELGKSVDFNVEGGETELDKTLIETLYDPIMHILRNCLDHGIETIEDRLKHGKPGKGKITLKAYYSGAHVIIKISDDGAGLKYERIKQKAIDKGLIGVDESIDEKELANLLFSAGFSTAKKVTDVSGRGVGMDIVKKKIEEIRGVVNIESSQGSGTSITIRLPLTLSIIDGLQIKVNDTSYIIQVTSVHKIKVVDTEQIRNCYNDLIIIDGEQIQIVNIRKEFNYNDYQEIKTHVVVVDFEGTKIGIVTDQIVGQLQAVIKPLGKFYKEQEYISGASILGDGSVALILDIKKLIYQSINLKQK